MFKSLFSKLLAGYLIIFVLTLAAFSAAMSFIWQGSMFSEKERTLELGAEQVNQQIVALYQGATSREGLDSAIDSIGSMMDSRIYAMELVQERLMEAQETLKEGEDGVLLADLLHIMEGKTIFRRQKYSAELDTYMVFYGRPLVVDGVITGAIIQYSPVDQIRSGLYAVYRQIWTVGITVALLSIAVIYLFARRISRPIQDMKRAAVQLAAGGETVEDIPVTGSDEISSLAEVFNEMKRKLVQIETMRRDFIAGISHELRTPLTSILGFVQGIQDGLVPKREIPGALGIIQEETRRMISLTGEILDLVKLENGSNELFPEHFRVFEALTFIVGTLNINEKKPGLAVEMVCPEDLYVWADADRFRQIMLNLLSNAIKYTNPPGRILIQAEHSGEMVLFGVIDSGVGIEEAELPLVFERFYRTDKSRHSSTGGVGLGLNIAKSTVEQHGGRIWLESQVGVGTKVWFTLPANPPSDNGN